MNIKEHIEAGHYPTDDQGRALVHIGDLGDEGWTGGLATVLATDGNVGEEIIARFPGARACHWAAGGRKSWPAPTKAEREYILLPPPPRKVKVTRWVLLGFNGFTLDYTAEEELANRWRKDPDLRDRVVELTGEYTVPRS